MRTNRDELIARLAANAAIPSPGRSVAGDAWRWLAAATVIAFAAIVWRGPLREEAFAGLFGSLPLLLQFVAGSLAIAAAGMAAFRTAIPSSTSMLRQSALALLLIATWLALHVYGVVTSEPGAITAGKRDGCWLESLLYGVPALVLGGVAVRRLWPLHGAWTGMLLGAAAGAVPAVLMQLACMPSASHALGYHVAPGLALAAVGAASGALFLRSR